MLHIEKTIVKKDFQKNKSYYLIGEKIGMQYHVIKQFENFTNATNHLQKLRDQQRGKFILIKHNK